jgi:hypothetical protein
MAYNSSQQELEALRDAALGACQSMEGDVQAGSSMASHLRALGGHVARRMRGALRLGSRRPSVWCSRTTESTSGRCPRAVSSLTVLTTMVQRPK